MDLIQLTRLSAWRITLGKWAALMSQTTLLVISILPYLVMRYFFGGIDMIQEFLILFFVFFISALLTALAVGFSGFISVLLRGFILVAAGLFSFSMVMTLSFSGISGGRGIFPASSITTADFWWSTATFILAGIYAIYFLLDLGASQIAPRAENHATRKRLITLVFVAAILSMAFTGVDEKVVMALGAIAIILAWIDAITERPSILPCVLEPFEKNRVLSIGKYLFTPGWHTGILFVLISGLAFVALSALTTNPVSSWTFGKLEHWALIISWTGAITYPLIFIHLFIPNSKQMFGLYMLIQCCTIIVTLLISTVSDSISNLNDVLFFYFPIPAVSVVALSDSVGRHSPMYFLVASSIFTLLSIAIPCWRACPLYKQMHAGNNALTTDEQFKVNRLLR